MHLIEIPPKFQCFLFGTTLSVSPWRMGYKLVFAPCLQSALDYVSQWNYEQASDFTFHYISEVSLSDIHIHSQLHHQCVLDL